MASVTPDLRLCNIDLLAPFLTELFNRSLALGTVPDMFKAAFITPMLKKLVVMDDFKISKLDRFRFDFLKKI